MYPPFLKTIKQRFKRIIRRTSSAYVNVVHRFTPEDLKRALSHVSLTPGDVVMVHSSLERFEGFTGGVGDIIDVLKQCVGEEGTILMPTLPFRESAVDYARSGIITDVRTAPSQVGFITEIFRRMPGVVRSIHPTHPVAAWGKAAEAIVRHHHTARTPCGRDSPYLELLARQGKILFLGTSVRTMTFYHGLEELLEPELPFSPFTMEEFELRTRDLSGEVIVTTTRLYDQRLSGKRDVEIAVPHLKSNGWWKEARVGRLSVILLESQRVRDTIYSMARQQIYCYHFP